VIVSPEARPVAPSTVARLEPRRRLIHRYDGILLFSPFALLLIGVIATVYGRLDPTLGFDYRHHLDYARYLDFTARIPLATRGWQMYHPPAYYAATALLFEALHRLGGTLTLTDAGRWLATAAWIVEGGIAGLAVKAWRGSWLGTAAAAAIVWLLPGQSMMGAMIYNETFTGLGVGIIVLGVALWPHSARWGLALIAVGVPVAALSKYSGLAAAAAAIVVVLWRGRRRPWPVLAALAPGVLMIGVFYWHNLHRLGTPFPLNSIIFHLQAWDPLGWGHPAGYFTRVDLTACAAPVSFIGGFWKWFFATDCYKVAPWPSTMSPLMLAGALLLSAVLVVALAWLVINWRADVSRLLLVAIPVAVLGAFLLYVIRIPSATTDKGVYTLSAIVPLAVAAGIFISYFVRRRPAMVLAYAGLLGWSVVMANASGLA
jgi:hypothetical protein